MCLAELFYSNNCLIIASSKPRATVKWSVNDLPRKAKFVKFEQSHYRGKSTISVIEFKATYKDHGKIFRCFGENPTLTQATTQANLTLDVLCKFTIFYHILISKNKTNLSFLMYLLYEIFYKTRNMCKL